MSEEDKIKQLPFQDFYTIARSKNSKYQQDRKQLDEDYKNSPITKRADYLKKLTKAHDNSVWKRRGSYFAWLMEAFGTLGVYSVGGVEALSCTIPLIFSGVMSCAVYTVACYDGPKKTRNKLASEVGEENLDEKIKQIKSLSTATD